MKEMLLRELFTKYLLQFVGTPYTYGKQDCSWLAQEALAFCGLDPKGDQTANDLYQHFMMYGKADQVRKDLGYLAFFGRPDRVSHVGVLLNDTHMIEAGGGDETTLTPADALKRGHAYVRVRPLNSRRDLVEIIIPNGLPW